MSKIPTPKWTDSIRYSLNTPEKGVLHFIDVFVKSIGKNSITLGIDQISPKNKLTEKFLVDIDPKTYSIMDVKKFDTVKKLFLNTGIDALGPVQHLFFNKKSLEKNWLKTAFTKSGEKEELFAAGNKKYTLNSGIPLMNISRLDLGDTAGHFFDLVSVKKDSSAEPVKTIIKPQIKKKIQHIHQGGG